MKALTPAELFYRRTFEGDDLEFVHQNLRVQSFKIAGDLAWPFMEDCNCTPQKVKLQEREMAALQETIREKAK